MVFLFFVSAATVAADFSSSLISSISSWISSISSLNLFNILLDVLQVLAQLLHVLLDLVDILLHLPEALGVPIHRYLNKDGQVEWPRARGWW